MEYSQAINERVIQSDFSILQSLKKMDAVNKKLLLVFDKDNFIGVLSIGDIQKAIIGNMPMDTRISSIIRKDFLFAKITEDKETSIQLMQHHRIECMPVLNEYDQLVTAYFWEDVFIEKKINQADLKIPVVIMAGGKGSRLKPLTNVLPKPLIPIGAKTIVEEIMDRFINAGCDRFFMSVNYKAEMIKYYLDSLKNNTYVIDYIQEKEPLGTAGSLFLLKDKIHSTFFISNCDIILDLDLEEFFQYHKNNRNKISVVSVLKNISIPYGTIETIEGGILDRLTEKPELTIQINSGMYLLEPEVLDLIPTNSFFHITDLIEKELDQGERVGVFPVSEGSWTDIGDWHEYNKIITNPN